jgi:hypothetical protein
MTTKMKNSTFAIPAAAAEIPVKPNKPAMIDIIKNSNANLSIDRSADCTDALSGRNCLTKANTGLPAKIASGSKPKLAGVPIEAAAIFNRPEQRASDKVGGLRLKAVTAAEVLPIADRRC